jgi:hypothetical protein
MCLALFTGDVKADGLTNNTTYRQQPALTSAMLAFPEKGKLLDIARAFSSC